MLRIAPVGLALVLLCAGAGCDTINQDLQDFTSGWIATSPGEAAREMVDPYDPDKRREGTVLIANSPFGGDEVYVRVYRDMVINEDDPIVKSVAIRALGKHGDPEDAVIIATYLDDEHLQIRWEAAKALQRLHSPKVVAALLAVLRQDEEDSDVRTASACALGQYPQDRVFQGLVAAIEARELALNLSAAESLHLLTGESIGMDSRAWLAWYNATRAEGDPFAGQQPYTYPTYQREESWVEKMAFWSRPTYEQPAPPAGLVPDGQRSTYQDEDEGAQLEPGG